MKIPRKVFVTVALVLVLFGCKSKDTLSEDEMHLCACAGEYMWLSLVMDKMYPPTDPEPRETREIAYWFLKQAGSVVGQDRAIAMSNRTADELSSRANQIGMRSLILASGSDQHKGLQ